MRLRVVRDRLLVDGRCLKHLHKRGQQVRLVGLKFPVSVSWYYLKREMANWKNDCSVTKPQSKHDYMVGKRRWGGWFKTAKHRLVYTVCRVLALGCIVG